MDATFERGSRESPRGHAFLYFRSRHDSDEIWASYLVMLPIEVDVSKYVPPFLMGQVGDLGAKELSAFAFPPAPEKVDSYAGLEELAALRDDDVVFCGTLDASDVLSAMTAVGEVTQWYADIYSERAGQRPSSSEEPGAQAEGVAVNEIVYGLMSENDKLGELTKLVGKLRYALDGPDEALMKEAEGDITLLATHLPENPQIPRLIEATKSGGNRGAMLADLYLKRCFHLIQEEYVKLGQVEEQIKAQEAHEIGE